MKQRSNAGQMSIPAELHRWTVAPPSLPLRIADTGISYEPTTAATSTPKFSHYDVGPYRVMLETHLWRLQKDVLQRIEQAVSEHPTERVTTTLSKLLNQLFLKLIHSIAQHVHFIHAYKEMISRVQNYEKDKETYQSHVYALRMDYNQRMDIYRKESEEKIAYLLQQLKHMEQRLVRGDEVRTSLTSVEEITTNASEAARMRRSDYPTVATSGFTPRDSQATVDSPITLHSAISRDSHRDLSHR